MMVDPLVRKALYNTFYYAVFFIPLSTLWGICVDLMLNLKVRGMTVYGRFSTYTVSCLLYIFWSGCGFSIPNMGLSMG